MMVCLLLNAYSIGIRLFRHREKLCERDVVSRLVSANPLSDHRTIARFRQENGNGSWSAFSRRCSGYAPTRGW